MATVLTDGGAQWAATRLASTETDGRWVAWGTGAGTADVTDTTLFTEASETRVAGVVSVVGTGSATSYQVISTLTANGTKTITNAGNFTASSAGTLLVKGDFVGIALQQNDSIAITIQIRPLNV